jgi:chaperone required for assembly of F1-ATPase
MKIPIDQAHLEKISRDNYERPLPKRFYKDVTISEEHGILLDGRAVKTPLKAHLIMSTHALAEAVAEEWRAQTDVINPGVMPLTRYANTVIDRAPVERDNLIDELMDYAGNDLVCYRAASPADLIKLQRQYWDPVLTWVSNDLGAQLKTTEGMMHVAQPPEELAKVRARLEQYDPIAMTVLYNFTTLTGSVLLSLMLVEGAISGAQAWDATHVDEDYQITFWGEDAEAQKRRAGRHIDFAACLRFLQLSRK